MVDELEAVAQHGQVPADLLELYEVLEYQRLLKEANSKPIATASLLTATESVVISRDAWGARPPKSTSTSINPAAGGIAWHYEGPHMGIFPHSSCTTKVRGIQAFHMDTRKWADIAYTTMYCPHGYIFVGRWWGKRTAAQGTNDGNERYYAACFLGGVDDPFSVEAQMAALSIRKLATEAGKAGPDNQPHSHFHSTGCPGDLIRNWLTAGMPSPIPQPLPTPEGDDMKQVFYRVSVDPLNSKPAPGDNSIWTTTDSITTHLVSEAAWVHAKNLGWWDESNVIFIPQPIHAWLIENTRGGNTGA